MIYHPSKHQDLSQPEDQSQRPLNGLLDASGQPLNPEEHRKSQMPNNVLDLIPLQLGVMEELIVRYVEDDELGIVHRYTVPFKDGRLADPAFVTVAPRVTSFGDAVLTHNWNGTKTKTGKEIPILEFDEECQWAEKYFTGKNKSNPTLRKLYFESRFRAGFEAGNTLHGNVFPGLRKGTVLGVCPEPLYIWAVQKLWVPYFLRFPYNPIYICGKNWATKAVIKTMETGLSAREIIPLDHPYAIKKE